MIPLVWPDGPPGEDRATSIALPKNFAAAHPFNHGNIAGRDETIVPAPRTTEDVQLERAVYYAIVEKLDQRVGRMLQAIEQSADPTNWLVVFTSDQGLALGSHGLMGKQNQYDHTINTPLIISGPELKAGQKLDAQCALRDLYPTVCDLMGLSIPDSVQGKSLLPLLGGKTSAGADEVYGYFTDSQRMLRTADGWKLIWYPKIDRVQLFHVANDGDELIDLANEPTQVERRQTMLARLKDWIALHDNRAARH